MSERAVVTETPSAVATSSLVKPAKKRRRKTSERQRYSIAARPLAPVGFPALYSPKVWRAGDMKKLCLWLAVAVVIACGPSDEVDPRTTIKAEGQHKKEIAKAVNGSKFWQAYLEKAGSGSKPVVVLEFTVERKTYRSSGGDYDPGKISVDFKARSAKNNRLLYKNDMEVRLKDFVIGKIDKDASREEIQEIAFRATEKKVYPYLNRWVNISAIQAMGNEGSGGSRFEPTLNEMLADKWTSDDLRAAAEEALQKIKDRG